MAFRLIFFHLITAMVAVNLIFAEEEEDRFFAIPFLGNNSSSFFSILSNHSLPSLLNFGSFGSRAERSVEPQEEDSSDSQERLFFASVIPCNYTTQGGTSCPSCRQALACYPNNVGRLRTCRGLLRYCNGGRCSFSPGAACSNSTAG